MPRQYVFSNIMKLRELRQARNKSMLAQEVARMSKQINQRFYRLEKAGLSKDSYAYQLASNQTGKQKPRYSTSKNVLEKLPADTLYQLALEINEKISSNTSAITGVRQVQEKRISNSLETIKNESGIDIDRNDFEQFLQLGGAELLREFDSFQIIEDFYEQTKNGKVTVKEFIREFKRYKDIRNVDYTKVLRNLKAITQRKINRAKRK